MIGTNNRYKGERLEDNSIDFRIDVNYFIEKLPNTYLGKTFASQLSRSNNSPTSNYGVAQTAKSTKDFTHRIGFCLKEILHLFKETNELISIFIANIKTVKIRL